LEYYENIVLEEEIKQFISGDKKSVKQKAKELENEFKQKEKVIGDYAVFETGDEFIDMIEKQYEEELRTMLEQENKKESDNEIVESIEFNKISSFDITKLLQENEHLFENRTERKGRN